MVAAKHAHPPETTAVIMVLEDILAYSVILERDSTTNDTALWEVLYNSTIIAYRNYTTISPSACSSCGLQSLLHFIDNKRGPSMLPSDST